MGRSEIWDCALNFAPVSVAFQHHSYLLHGYILKLMYKQETKYDSIVQELIIMLFWRCVILGVWDLRAQHTDLKEMYQ